MTFDDFIAKAWDAHAAEPADVAQRLGDATALVGDEAQLERLMTLAHHLYGEHLGRWHDGIAFIEPLSALPAFVPEGKSGQARRRCLASLRIAAGDEFAFDALGPSDRVRVGAMAASNLAPHDAAHADRLLRDALDLADRSALPSSDPLHRALAIAGNGLACALEEKPDRSADERALMVLAAETARRHWEIAGTWLEIERAEYRLACTCLQAGDLDRARTHAEACLAIVDANGGLALERLFAWEAIGRVARAAGDAPAHEHALAQARQAFDALDENDKVWCAESIDKLAVAAT